MDGTLDQVVKKNIYLTGYKLRIGLYPLFMHCYSATSSVGFMNECNKNIVPMSKEIT